MKRLELLLPPLPLTLILSLGIFAFAYFLPNTNIQIDRSIQEWAIAFWVLAIVFVLPAAISFFKAKTTVDPRYPEKSKALVINGLYKISRNPMYVGFLFILMGCTLFTGNIIGALITILFVPYMNRFQISPEELHLKDTFGEQYIDYCQRVRRWL